MAIVSRNSGTLDGLETYLQGAGVTTHGTRRIERSAVVGAGASALVVFPDDFSWGAVVSALTESRRRNPRALPLVITCSPQRFEALTWRDEGAIPLLVPKPAWGWTILDAIRAHRHEQSAPESGP